MMMWGRQGCLISQKSLLFHTRSHHVYPSSHRLGSHSSCNHRDRAQTKSRDGMLFCRRQTQNHIDRTRMSAEMTHYWVRFRWKSLRQLIDDIRGDILTRNSNSLTQIYWLLLSFLNHKKVTVRQPSLTKNSVIWSCTKTGESIRIGNKKGTWVIFALPTTEK